MLRAILIPCLLLFLFGKLYPQNHDFVWLFGYDSYPNDLSFGGTVMDFNTVPPNIYYQFRAMNFSSTNASISDFYGNLQFYSNGIYIANKNHQQMENGLGLNPGLYAIEFADIGYNLSQGAIAIPSPNNQQKYYIFHASLEYPEPGFDWHCSNLYYTLLNMTYNGGLGKVLAKNQVIINDTLSLGKLTGVCHANGRDWWIIFHEIASPNYYRILVTPTGIQNLGKESTGVGIPEDGLGQAVFSPDG